MFANVSLSQLLAAPSKSVVKSSAGAFSAEAINSAVKKAHDSFPETFAAHIEEASMQNFLSAAVQEEVFGMIVVSSKATSPSMLRHVGAVTRDIVKIAYVSNPSPQFLQQFGLTDATALPTALALVPPPEGDKFSVMKYEEAHFGSMNFRSLTSFVYNVLEG